MQILSDPTTPASIHNLVIVYVIQKTGSLLNKNVDEALQFLGCAENGILKAKHKDFVRALKGYLSSIKEKPELSSENSEEEVAARVTQINQLIEKVSLIPPLQSLKDDYRFRLFILFIQTNRLVLANNQIKLLAKEYQVKYTNSLISRVEKFLEENEFQSAINYITSICVGLPSLKSRPFLLAYKKYIESCSRNHLINIESPDDIKTERKQVIFSVINSLTYCCYCDLEDRFKSIEFNLLLDLKEYSELNSKLRLGYYRFDPQANGIFRIIQKAQEIYASSSPADADEYLKEIERSLFSFRFINIVSKYRIYLSNERTRFGEGGQSNAWIESANNFMNALSYFAHFRSLENNVLNNKFEVLVFKKDYASASALLPKVDRSTISKTTIRLFETVYPMLEDENEEIALRELADFLVSFPQYPQIDYIRKFEAVSQLHRRRFDSENNGLNWIEKVDDFIRALGNDKRFEFICKAFNEIKFDLLIYFDKAESANLILTGGSVSPERNMNALTLILERSYRLFKKEKQGDAESYLNNMIEGLGSFVHKQILVNFKQCLFSFRGEASEDVIQKSMDFLNSVVNLQALKPFALFVETRLMNNYIQLDLFNVASEILNKIEFSEDIGRSVVFNCFLKSHNLALALKCDEAASRLKVIRSLIPRFPLLSIFDSYIDYLGLFSKRYFSEELGNRWFESATAFVDVYNLDEYNQKILLAVQNERFQFLLNKNDFDAAFILMSLPLLSPSDRDLFLLTLVMNLIIREIGTNDPQELYRIGSKFRVINHQLFKAYHTFVNTRFKRTLTNETKEDLLLALREISTLERLLKAAGMEIPTWIPNIKFQLYFTLGIIQKDSSNYKESYASFLEAERIGSKNVSYMILIQNYKHLLNSKK